MDDRILIISDDSETLSNVTSIIKTVRPENGIKVVRSGEEAVFAMDEIHSFINQIIFDCSVKDRMIFLKDFYKKYAELDIPFIFICNKCFEFDISKSEKYLCTKLDLNIIDIVQKPIDKFVFFKVYKEASKAKHAFQHLRVLKKQLNVAISRATSLIG